MKEAIYGVGEYRCPSYCAYCGEYFLHGDKVYYYDNIPGLTGKAFCTGLCANLYREELRLIEQVTKNAASKTHNTAENS